METNGPFAAERSRGTNRQTGEQMTHWDMLNKENSNIVALFNLYQCVICSPVWRFLYNVIAQLQKSHCVCAKDCGKCRSGFHDRLRFGRLDWLTISLDFMLRTRAYYWVTTCLIFHGVNCLLPEFLLFKVNFLQGKSSCVYFL